MAVSSPALIREVMIISGKGGTGKTSVTISFAVLNFWPVSLSCYNFCIFAVYGKRIYL